MRTHLRRLGRRLRITGTADGSCPSYLRDKKAAVYDIAPAGPSISFGDGGSEATSRQPPKHSAPNVLRRLPFRRIPILINSFNRLHCLRGLIDWLEDAGYSKLVIIDNASSYPPLRSYLARLERKKRASVVRLESNFGHLAIWEQGLLGRLGIDSEYVYTDPDILPAEFCPPDVVGVFREIFREEADIATVGFGLRLDDIPDQATHKAQVLAWENQFWLAPAAPGVFLAPIDTTFALYRPRAGRNLSQASLRTGWPYLASHVGWLVDHQHPTEEDVFYFRSVKPNTSHWSVPQLPAWLAAAQEAAQLSRPLVVHLDDTEGGLPGYTVIKQGGNEAGAGGWLRGCARLAEDSVDGFYCEDNRCRFLEGPSLLRTLHRKATQNAQLVLRLPGRAVEILDLEQPCLFPALGPTGPDRVVRCDWNIERLVFVIGGQRETPDADTLQSLIRHPRIVREIILHMRAVKPPPPLSSPIPMRQKADFAFSRLYRWQGFAKIASPGAAVQSRVHTAD